MTEACQPAIAPSCAAALNSHATVMMSAAAVGSLALPGPRRMAELRIARSGWDISSLSCEPEWALTPP